jgi:hypothetical protein
MKDMEPEGTAMAGWLDGIINTVMARAETVYIISYTRT